MPLAGAIAVLGAPVLGLSVRGGGSEWAVVVSATVAAAGAALIALALWRRGAAKDRGRAGESAHAKPATDESSATRSAMVCPGCGEGFAAGARFCPNDARRLVPAASAVGPRKPARLACPRCRRVFDAGSAGHRFCPFDAEELESAGSGAHEHSVDETEHASTHGELHPPGNAKICPLCASKYSLDTTFCGRDGSELMTVN